MEKACKLLQGKLVEPYQTDGVRWMLEREQEFGGFLCDEMGLGKTIQTITTMIGNPQSKTLIVCPKSLISQWVSEIRKFAPFFVVGVYESNTHLVNIQNIDILVTSYSLFSSKKVECPLLRHKWNRVIFDEGHEIRNWSATRTKNLYKLRADIRWILTGTPVFNSIKDFTTLCKIIGIPVETVKTNTAGVCARYALRRTKEDVKIDIPECTFENIDLDMYPEEQQLYSEVINDSREQIRNMIRYSGNIAMHNMDILECLLRCRQAMIHPQLYIDGMAKKNGEEPQKWEYRSKKIEKLVEMVQEVPEEEKSIVFCHFIEEMNMVDRLLTDCGIRTFRIDGSTSTEERAHALESYKTCEEKSAILIQIKAGGVGLNIQCATRVFMTSVSWNPATELQAIGRAHRTGQTKPVFVYRLVYKSTEECMSVEESMMNLQEHKSIVCSEVLNDPRLLRKLPKKKHTGTFNIKDIVRLFTQKKK